MRNRNSVCLFLIFILVHLFVETMWSQEAESVYIYNKQGDKYYTNVRRIYSTWVSRLVHRCQIERHF